MTPRVTDHNLDRNLQPFCPAEVEGAGLAMVYFKSCARCSGDRILDKDVYGWYMLCLACGYVTYPQVKVRDALSTSTG